MKKHCLSIQQMTNKVALINDNKELHDAMCTIRKNNICNCPSAAFDHLKPVPTTIDDTFNRDGRTWRVTVVVDTFIIATAVDAQRDAQGDVYRESDIIRVGL